MQLGRRRISLPVVSSQRWTIVDITDLGQVLRLAI